MEEVGKNSAFFSEVEVHDILLCKTQNHDASVLRMVVSLLLCGSFGGVNVFFFCFFLVLLW